MYANSLLTLFCLFLYFVSSLRLKCIVFNSFGNTTFNSIQSYQEYKDFHMCNVVFKQANINNLNAFDFSDFKDGLITSLTLYDNNIHNIDDGTLYMLQYLNRLDLGNNHISRISNKIFSHVVRLEWLNLSENNNLQEIPVDAFTSNVNLKHLSFAKNRITTVSDDLFNNLENLAILDLSYNRLTRIYPLTFGFIKKLIFLNLEFNEFTTFQIEKFSVPNLKRLNLAGNFLQLFDVKFFSANSLVNLNLSHNKLKALNPSTMKTAFPELIRLDLNGNPWPCPDLMFAINILEESGVNCSGNGSNFGTTTFHGIGCEDVVETDETQKMQDSSIVTWTIFYLIILAATCVACWYVNMRCGLCYKLLTCCRSQEIVQQENYEQNNL